MSQLNSRISTLNTNLRIKDDQLELLLKSEPPFHALRELVRSTISRCKNQKWFSLEANAQTVKEWLTKIKQMELSNR